MTIPCVERERVKYAEKWVEFDDIIGMTGTPDAVTCMFELDNAPGLLDLLMVTFTFPVPVPLTWKERLVAFEVKLEIVALETMLTVCPAPPTLIGPETTERTCKVMLTELKKAPLLTVTL